MYRVSFVLKSFTFIALKQSFKYILSVNILSVSSTNMILRTNRETETLSDRQTDMFVFLYYAAWKYKTTFRLRCKQAERCRELDKQFLQVHCQFMQLKRQMIQTRCCRLPQGSKRKWKAGGYLSSSLVFSVLVTVVKPFLVTAGKLEHLLRSYQLVFHGETLVWRPFVVW